jgi:hypothetical protein
MGTSVTSRPKLQRRWLLFSLFALAMGVFLRTHWIGDSEYKGDERAMVELVQGAMRGESLPSLGVHSGVGLRNPGLSLWVFQGLGWFFSAADPVSLTRIVQLCNVLALLLLWVFAWRIPPPAERPAWVWGVALVCVSPFFVLWSRKIWAQDLLPLFCVGILWGVWHRDRAWVSFGLGILLALVGQLHMSGFFLAAGVLGWHLGVDRGKSRVHASALAAGLVLGMLPAIPWLFYVFGGQAPAVAVQATACLHGCP